MSLWQILERAVRCGREVLAASQADGDWLSLAGDALDDALVLANRCALSRLQQKCRMHGLQLALKAV